MLLCEALETGLGGQTTNNGLISISDAVEYVNARLTSDVRFRNFRQSPSYGIDNSNGAIWIAANKSGSSDAPSNIQRTISSIDELKFAYESTSHSRRPCVGSTIRDLNWDLVRVFAGEGVREQAPDSTAMDRLASELGLYSSISTSKIRTPHNAAVLCFCERPERYFPQARATFVTGDTSEELSDLKQVRGSLSIQVNTLVDLTMRELRTAVTFKDGGSRQETAEIPREVIRELISNAITHRDYQAAGTVQVRVTSEFIEVLNPGSFPIGYSWEHFLKAEAVSCPNDAALALYLNTQLAFEGIGRGFLVFRKFLEERGEAALICETRAGPTVAVRVVRLRGQSDVESKFEQHYLAQVEQHIRHPINLQLLLGRRAGRRSLNASFVEPELALRRRGGRIKSIRFREFARSIRCCVIYGGPGSGKSAFLQALCTAVLRTKSGQKRLVPILGQLRRYNESRPILEFLTDEVNRISVEVPHPQYVEGLLESGRAMLALDGLDEIVNHGARQELVRSLNALHDRFPMVNIVVTSREGDYQGISDISDFQALTLLPLNRMQVQKFVKANLGADHAVAFLERTEKLQDLRGNPLLLSLMCMSFETVGDVAKNRLQSVEYCSDAVFNRWDAVKPGFRHMEQEEPIEHRELLTRVAIEMVRQGVDVIDADQMFEVVLDELQTSFDNELSRAREKAKWFVAFYSGRAGLIVEAAPAQFEFLHRIFMEYFAALYVAKSAPDAASLAIFVVTNLNTRNDIVALFACELWARRSRRRIREFYSAFSVEMTSRERDKRLVAEANDRLRQILGGPPEIGPDDEESGLFDREA